jgi:CRISPR/Cas system-associated endonuclease/helicase Cas3
MRFHLSGSAFLQTFAIVEMMFHIVNMLKIRVYLGAPAFLMTATSPPAVKYPLMNAFAINSALLFP